MKQVKEMTGAMFESLCNAVHAEQAEGIPHTGLRRFTEALAQVEMQDTGAYRIYAHDCENLELLHEVKKEGHTGGHVETVIASNEAFDRAKAKVEAGQDPADAFRRKYSDSARKSMVTAHVTQVGAWADRNDAPFHSAYIEDDGATIAFEAETGDYYTTLLVDFTIDEYGDISDYDYQNIKKHSATSVSRLSEKSGRVAKLGSIYRIIRRTFE